MYLITFKLKLKGQKSVWNITSLDAPRRYFSLANQMQSTQRNKELGESQYIQQDTMWTQ